MPPHRLLPLLLGGIEGGGVQGEMLPERRRIKNKSEKKNEKEEEDVEFTQTLPCELAI